MDELKTIGEYFAAQGPWAVICGIVFYGIYKFGGRVLDVIERNTSAFARVESSHSRIETLILKMMEKLDV